MVARTLSPRPQVAFDVTPLQSAHRVRGIGRYVDGLARALMDQHAVPIEFWGWHDDRPFEVSPPHRALWLRRFGAPRSRWSWFLGPLGMRLRARMSPVMAAHITDPRSFTVLQVPTLTTVYDLIPLLEPQPDRGTREFAAYRRSLARLPGARGIFAISRQTADDFSTHLRIPPPPVWIAPPGVSFPSPLVGEGQGGGSGNDAPFFLCIGSADPHKNLTLVLDALSLRPALPERLVFVGPWYGPNLRALQGWIAARPGLEGRVDYRGYVPDAQLGTLIRAATAVIVPSRREGFGLPVAEAMAGGGVVIHSRIPVLDEVSQGAALTFDPASPEQLAECLQRASEDPVLRDRLRREGGQRARSLGWERALAVTIDAYRSTLAR